MGQGAEDAGGYEILYDPYDEGLVDDVWTMRDGGTIKVTDMTVSHLTNTLAMVRRMHHRANFECDKDTWQEWIDRFRDELLSRPSEPKVDYTDRGPKKPTRGSKQQMKCHCGKEYPARVADLNRGWALSCSKRCAAIRREFGRHPAQPVNAEIGL